jgi:hypothetical protein
LRTRKQASGLTFTREVAERVTTRFSGKVSDLPRTRIGKGVRSDKEHPEGFELENTSTP